MKGRKLKKIIRQQNMVEITEDAFIMKKKSGHFNILPETEARNVSTEASLFRKDRKPCVSLPRQKLTFGMSPGNMPNHGQMSFCRNKQCCTR